MLFTAYIYSIFKICYVQISFLFYFILLALMKWFYLEKEQKDHEM